ncbi:MAG: hypothetical protein FJ404_19640 [Verrucomicrobia bacterium]|nr:hypothetical protein [Verrucomicrobiota bacterium]
MSTPTTKAEGVVRPPVALNIAAIIRKAVAVGRRPGGPRRREGILKILAKNSREGRQWVRIIQGFETAAWRIGRDGHGRYHDIEIGSAFHLQCVDRIRGHPRKLQRYCESLLRHEAAHGLFTEQDLDSIVRSARAVGVPLVLMNLLEDARVEHLERERSRDPRTGKPWRFHWWCFNGALTETNRPSRYLWSLINKEASSWSRYSAGAPRWLGKAGSDVRIRDHYYHQAIHAARTSDLIPLGQEWMAEFPLPRPSPPPPPN